MALPVCPSPQQLIDFCIGKLAEEDIDRVTNHLDLCPLCLEIVEALEKVPIPFVRYHLSAPDPQRQNVALDPQYQHLLGLLKRLNDEPATPAG